MKGDSLVVVAVGQMGFNAKEKKNIYLSTGNLPICRFISYIHTFQSKTANSPTRMLIVTDKNKSHLLMSGDYY